jgi:cell division protein FtsB
MKKNNRGKTRLSARIFSGIFFLTGLAILILIGISLGKEAYRRRQIQKEIEGLETQINQLGQENNKMQNLIGYLSSTEFQVKEAREKLNLQKSDEKMIVLQKDIAPSDNRNEDDPDNLQVSPEDKSPNWKKWWEHFFGQ